LIVAVCSNVPDVPVTVTVAPLSIFAVALAVSVRMLAPLPVMLLELKDAVTPLGKPEVFRFTVPAKLRMSATEIVLTPEAPWATVKAPGEAVSAKLLRMIPNTVLQPFAPPSNVVP
jgi:hypothetical protein